MTSKQKNGAVHRPLLIPIICAKCGREYPVFGLCAIGEYVGRLICWQCIKALRAERGKGENEQPASAPD